LAGDLVHHQVSLIFATECQRCERH
jgi:hypothetical protein